VKFDLHRGFSSVRALASTSSAGIAVAARESSSRLRRCASSNLDQSLATLASPDPSLTQAQSRHTQSELDTFLAQQELTASSPRTCRLPHVKRRAVHARGFARILRRTAQGASNTRNKALGPTCLGSRRVGPELSYRAQLSAGALYIRGDRSSSYSPRKMTCKGLTGARLADFASAHRPPREIDGESQGDD